MADGIKDDIGGALTRVSGVNGGGGGDPAGEDGVRRNESTNLWFFELSSLPTADGASAATLSRERSTFLAAAHRDGVRFTERYSFQTLWNGVSVEINPADIGRLSRISGIKAVYPIGKITYDPGTQISPEMESALAMTGADIAQSELGLTGAGVKVGIIDSGVDVTHPCFADTGFPATTQLGDKRFTNNKVIVAKVFNNKAGSKGYTAQAIGEHGTHVGGTVACDLTTAAKIGNVAIPYDPSGVAPGAQLGSYNVFPGDDGDARSEDILNAMEAAVVDGMDVLNMSLGGGSHLSLIHI